MSVDFTTQPSLKKPFKTVAEFEEWLSEQSNLIDKRFEFTNGKIIEKPAMKQEELFIVTFLLDLFSTTSTFKNKIGRLLPELDSHIDKQRKRIPDISYYTNDQIKEMRKGKKFATPFPIEIISPNDKLKDIEDKLNDYFNAGIKLVWYISPEQEQIYVYHSPTDIKIYKDTDVCSAHPIFPDFSFKVEDMFA